MSDLYGMAEIIRAGDDFRTLLEERGAEGAVRELGYDPHGIAAYAEVQVGLQAPMLATIPGSTPETLLGASFMSAVTFGIYLERQRANARTG